MTDLSATDPSAGFSLRRKPARIRTEPTRLASEPAAQPDPVAPRTETGPLIRVGVVGLGLLIASLAVTSLVPINGAVVAPGQVLVEGKPQPVQSLDPGIVATVAVRNGDQVEAGALLMALDPTLPRTRLDIARERLAAVLTEEARLMAEAEGLDQPRFDPPALPFEAPDLTEAAARQQALFDTRRAQRDEARKRLIETDAQLAAQIDGLTAQIAAAEEEAKLLREDLERQGALVADGLARRAPLLELQRQDAALSGRIASLQADRFRLDGARREAALALSQEEGRRDEEVAQGLRDTSTKIQELKAEIISLQEALSRTELRAPMAGIVHELQVPAPGSVVSAGAVLAQIVPTDRALEIEVLVEPRNIDSVHPGQDAKVMLSAFDPRVVPKLDATVTQVPPGAVTDPQTGRSFYRVSLQLGTDQLPADLDLRPGMPVQAFLNTGERPLLNWLLAPLMKPMARALREE